MSPLARAAGRGLVALAGVTGLALTPETVLAHTIVDQYRAPLPLVAYVAGAALAVAMSFVFVMLRAPTGPRDLAATGEPRTVPARLRRGIQAVGLIGWLWVAAQTLFGFAGGTGDADVGSLFMWIYGWVGVAIISALVGPIWTWLNPFATIHDLLAAGARRLGLRGTGSRGESDANLAQLGRWPAVIGFIVVVWLELAGHIEGGRSLGLIMLAYTFITVAAMGYFGRDAWLRNGETFSVWFELLNRLAPFRPADPDDERRVVRRPLGVAMLSEPWTVPDLVLVALGTGAIIFDGLSQTEPYFNLFIAQTPLGTGVLRDTITATVFLAFLTAVVLGAGRLLGLRAICAGLLPVAVGYLVAHYLTFLLFDGQRLIVALNDPLVRGQNLISPDLATWEPTAFLPTSIIWSIQLAAVVGGHVVGAWAGHAALADAQGRAPIGRQLPLAVLMVVLTTVTLWSLGQAVIIPPE